MSKIGKIIIFIFCVGLFFTALSSTVFSQENHYYSYSVREDGSANVWLRIDEVRVDKSNGKYSLELPKGEISKIKAWYKENNSGCVYPLKGEAEAGAIFQTGQSDTMERGILPGDTYPYPCVLEEIQWHEAKVEENDNKIDVTIAKSKQGQVKGERILSLGVSFKVNNVTAKKWWGREIIIETAKSKNFIPYLSVGVDAPPGIYIRDKQSPPADWGEFISKTAVSLESRGIGDMDSQTFNPVMFDNAGGGQIIKDRNNLQPGESFSFKLLTAASNWKLFMKEIGWMFVGSLILILVAALLLRLIIGRKPYWWYIVVIFLMAAFITIIVWLFTMYRSFFYYSNGAPINFSSN